MSKSLILTFILCVCLCGCLDDPYNTDVKEITPPEGEGSGVTPSPTPVATSTPVVTPTPTPSFAPTEILFEDFEAGWGNFIDGGLFSKISTDDVIMGGSASVFKAEGVISSFVQRKPMDLTPVESFSLSFMVRGDDLIDGDALLVEFSDGIEWHVLSRLVKGQDFDNDTFTEISIEVSNQDYIFSQGARVQFVGNTEANSVFIDNISIAIIGVLGEGLVSSQNGSYVFGHLDVELGCVGCHGNYIAVGKYASHLASLDDCQICHIPNNVNGWEAFPYSSGTYDHTDVTTGCFDCHNAVLAATKVSGHIESSDSCEQCHTTKVGGWNLLNPGEVYLHEGVTTGCVSCHNDGVAKGKTESHPPSSDACEQCHIPNQPWINISIFDQN